MRSSLLLLLAACTPEVVCPSRAEPTEPVAAPATPPNVLVILLDDIGTDQLTVYDVHPNPVHTPVMDGLAAEGMRFNQAIAHPVCSPSRASLMTGLMPHEHGIGSAIRDVETVELDPDTPNLGRALSEHPVAPYTTWALAKWHLSPPIEGWYDHPNLLGFDHYAGAPGNLWERPLIDDSGPLDFFNYEKITDGEVEILHDRYVTADTVEDAEEGLRTLPEPWFLSIGLHTAHVPYHRPPDDFVYTRGLSDSDDDLARLMVESADIAIGRILDAMVPEQRDRTWVFVMGDNGSTPGSTREPWLSGRSKRTMFRGGIRVPLLVRGPGLEPGGVTEELVQISDLYATILDLTGAEAPRPDTSVSFVQVLRGEPGARTMAVAERFKPNSGDRTVDRAAIRDDRYKLVFDKGLTRSLFDLASDPMEEEDILYLQSSADVVTCLTSRLPGLPGTAPQ